MKMKEIEDEKREEDLIEERTELCFERIDQIAANAEVPEKYRAYFVREAKHIQKVKKFAEICKENKIKNMKLDDIKTLYDEMYADILPLNYERSFLNPAYAVKEFGTKEGRLLSNLASMLVEMIFFAAEQNERKLVLLAELFVEVYCRFEEYDTFAAKDAKMSIRSYIMDNQRDNLLEVYSNTYCNARGFARQIIMSENADPANLYMYGEYITENEIKISKFLNEMKEADVRAMADTYVDGYLRGFKTMQVKLLDNGMIGLHYPIGFERMMKYAVESFEKLGYRVSSTRTGICNRSGRKHGFYATSVNPQFEYDHRQDKAMYFDNEYGKKWLENVEVAMEAIKEQASLFIGPALVEVFGEPDFEPTNKKEITKLDKRQQKLQKELDSSYAELVHRYIKDDQTSFTIIAYPLPSIGADFEAVFAETVKLNTLDNDEYKKIQQYLIDELDTGYAVHITGRNGNVTDMTVMLANLSDPTKETKFENCTADVNIPVGEVFTSPKLTGTNGLLHVNRIFLKGYEYRDLKLEFKDGKAVKITCKNFESDDENEAFVNENLLHHHEWLPLGEFAIGTNTTAFAMGRKFDIEEKLPILIAEKTGPHFAIGDTCYSRTEDHKVYNPDGKEIIARENEISALRKTEPKKAYFYCHTDITIPYGELGTIESIKKDGRKVALISEGRFVLKGTEELNRPLG